MKAQRQQAILRLIRQRPVSTQEELAAFLAEQGLEVTQATVSRDIRELRLVKVAEGGGYRYAEPPQAPPADAYGRVRRAFAEFVLTIEYSGNMIVVKTSPGTANAVAASIDEAGFATVLATLAGDDVVLIIVRTTPRPAGPEDTTLRSLLAELHELWKSPSTG